MVDLNRGANGIPISTRRFLLTDFAENHRKPFIAYQSDRRYRAALPAGVPADPAALFDTFLGWAADRPRRNYQLAIVERDPPNRLIGCCGLRPLKGVANEGELGIELAPDFWGRYAVALEVVEGLLPFAFRKLGWSAIIGKSTAQNASVHRLAEWFGAEVVSSGDDPTAVANGRWSEVVWRMSLSHCK